MGGGEGEGEGEGEVGEKILEHQGIAPVFRKLRHQVECY